jgi:hypothetical protein
MTARRDVVSQRNREKYREMRYGGEYGIGEARRYDVFKSDRFSLFCDCYLRSKNVRITRREIEKERERERESVCV